MRDLFRGKSAMAVPLFLFLNCGGVQANDDAVSERQHEAEAMLGPVVNESVLAAQRGGADLHVSENNATANVQDNVARNLTTGNNTITESAFANATGIPMVVQNSGNNVVIQNSTILNLQMK